MTTPEITIPRKGAPRPSDALEQIADNAGAHEMRDPFDIGEALETLARSGEAVSVHPSGMVKGLLLARLHSVDPEQPTFVIDFAGAIPPSGPATFVAALSGNAKVQFELDQEWRGLPGEPNLVPAQFPPFCLVLNRRAAQRVGTPVGIYNTASFTLLSKPYELPLDDVSLGGVGLRATPEEAFGLRVGKKIDNVQLRLGPALVLTADLEIRLLRPFKTFLLGEQVQIGCSFANITMQTRQQVERYIAATNRIRRGA
ncbi:MAG: pilus assembly protein PilZ [Massilia sp.]|nr:pilus assembly protein PilZ [Massilia sp.]